MTIPTHHPLSGSPMRLAELARSLERLEESSSRRTMVQVVAELLGRARTGEIAAVVYLLQAQLRPPYEGIEIGLGEKLLVKAVSQAYGKTVPAVVARLHRTGDLGLVAGALAPATGAKRLSVGVAYDTLLRIANSAGPGSQRHKIGLLAAMLRNTGAPEAKLLVRVAQGRLRLGAGDQTILEAAALAALGDRTLKPLLEQAYNVRSDLGSVVHLAFTKGKRGLVNAGPMLGVPVRPALAQRLASAEEIIERLGEVQVEPKYDGFRLQCHRDGSRVAVFSRRLEDVTGMFPELALGIRRQLRTRRAIIEGEAVVHNPDTGEFLPFQVTITRKRKTRVEETAKRYPLRLFAFDVLYAGRRNYIPRPQRERGRRLRQLLPFAPDDPIAVTERIVTKQPGVLEDYFDEMVHRGLEGIVAKRLDAPYQAGSRGFAWVKLKRAYQSKLRDTVDLVLVGYLRGRGKRAALGIGSVLAAVYDPHDDRFRTVAKIGSGLTDAAWKVLRARLDAAKTIRRPARVDSLIEADVWVSPRLVVEVLADEVTRSPFHTCGRREREPGYALRFPRILGGVREDKAATDATTAQEVLALYQMQRKRGSRGRSTRSLTTRRVASEGRRDG